MVNRKLIGFVGLVGLTASLNAGAFFGDLVAEFEFGASKFARDDARGRLYVTIEEENSLAVIDIATLELVDKFFVGSSPLGLAMSPDGSRLYVATSGASSLGVVDLETLALLSPIELPDAPTDVRAGVKERIYAMPDGMVVDAASGDYLGSFPFQLHVSGDFLELSPDGSTLYVADRGTSPASLYQLDISVDNPLEPALLWEDDHGSLGSNGQDLALSHHGEYISIAVGSGNDQYDIFKMRTSDFAVLGSFETGAYPREVTYSPDGETVYTVHTRGQIEAFDARTFLQRDFIPTPNEESSELITDRLSRLLFAAFPGHLRVYEVTELGSPPCSRWSEWWVQQAYIAYYGRPADPAGSDFWACRMDDEGGDLSSIIQAFGTSAEYDSRYAGLDVDTLITNIYLNLFNREPDDAGLEFYRTEYLAGRMTLQTIALNVLVGAQNEDATIIENKLSAAGFFTSAVRGGKCPYSAEDIDDAVAYLNSVLDNDSVAEAKLQLIDDCSL